MGYIANHDVHHDGTAYELGETVVFSTFDQDRFRQQGLGPIAELLASAAIREDTAVRIGVALDDQSTEQLAATAAVLGLGIGAAAGRDALVDAIEAARAQLAGAPRENPVRTAEGEVRGVAERTYAPTAAGERVGGFAAPVADTLTVPLPIVDDEVAARLGLDGPRPSSLPDTGETAPRGIPELKGDEDRARLVEIAAEHGVPHASNASAHKLAELIGAARRERTAPPAGA